jgi:hypothetical protein
VRYVARGSFEFPSMPERFWRLGQSWRALIHRVVLRSRKGDTRFGTIRVAGPGPRIPRHGSLTLVSDLVKRQAYSASSRGVQWTRQEMASSPGAKFARRALRLSASRCEADWQTARAGRGD